jgi:hypothetical protein
MAQTFIYLFNFLSALEEAASNSAAVVESVPATQLHSLRLDTRRTPLSTPFSITRLPNQSSFHTTMSSTQPQPEAASASALPEGITDPNYKPPPGRLGNLTVIQQHSLDKLRKELQDEDQFVPERMDDATLLRHVFV